MASKWNLSRWGTFKWGHSASWYNIIDQKTGLHIKNRIIWKLAAGDFDITQYFVSSGSISQEKERAPDRMSAGDMMLVLNNTSGAFNEKDTASRLNGVVYHNKNITIEVGLELPDGSVEYHKVATMKVRSIDFSSDQAQVKIRLYDHVERFLDETINRRPSSMVAAFNGANGGNGTITNIDTKPFKTKTEDWTLNCTLAGGDSTATFSVVGSVSGNIGTATSGTEFSNATTGGIKFTIRVGTVNWALNDKITFSTVQMMEWAATNPMKILWSILTGTNYTTLANEDWKTRTPQLSSVQNSSNADIDWASFKKMHDDVGDAFTTIKGYIRWDHSLSEVIEQLVFHVLGAATIDAEGRLKFKMFVPEIAPGNPLVFSDTKKIRTLSYERNMRDIINHVSFRYRKTDVWPWTNEREEDTLDGLYVALNQTSHDDYGQWFSKIFNNRWYSASGSHVSYPANRIIDKYGTPPERFKADGGIDAIEAEIGDVVQITDAKSLHTNYNVEIMRKDADYTERPAKIYLEMDDTRTTGIKWCFLGSESNEGDGASPQAVNFDNASLSDKTFCYLGDDAQPTGPQYKLF